MVNRILKPLDEYGRSIVEIVGYSLHVFQMVYLSFRATLFDQAQGFRTIVSVISAQVYFTGWQALPIVTVLAFASGAVVVLQSTAQLSRLGGGALLGEILVAIIVRELAPLIPSLVVIARSGTAVASELGNMRANRETEALEVMGINPLSFIVFPRLLGGVISVICLAVYFTLISLGAGYVVVRLMNDMAFAFYVDIMAQALTMTDVFLFLAKNTFGGTIIFVVCSYQGMMVKESPHEVPQVTTKAVVNSIIYVVCFNATVTVLSYLSTLARLGVI